MVPGYRALGALSLVLFVEAMASLRKGYEAKALALPQHCQLCDLG